MMQSLDPSPSGRRSGTAVLYPSGAIGDTLWHLSIFQALAASDPSGRIDLVANERLPIQALLGGQAAVARYLMLPLNRRNPDMTRIRGAFFKDLKIAASLLRALRAGRYRRMFILTASRRHVIATYTLIARLAGIAEIYGYAASPGQGRLLTGAVPLRGENKGLFPLYLGRKLLDAAGVAHGGARVSLRPDPLALDRARGVFGASPRPWVAFGIGATHDSRIWPPERTAAIADALWRQGYRSLFLLGAPHEAGLVREIVARCEIAKPVGVTDLPLTEIVALLSLCAFAICTDSGLMNVAALLDIPVYVIASTRFSPACFETVAPGDFAARLKPVVPEGGIDPEVGASKVTVERVLARLREDGIIASVAPFGRDMIGNKS